VWTLRSIEVLALSAPILAARCANLSGRFCRRKCLIHRCGLLRADDARPHVRLPFRFDRASPHFRNYPQATTPTRRRRSIISLSHCRSCSSLSRRTRLIQPALSQSNRTSWFGRFTSSIFPVLRDWDERLWPNEMEYARRVEQRNESVQLRDLAISLESSTVRPFLAPWWF
jgi:hypothetical protein